jgi:hypothetical protein
VTKIFLAAAADEDSLDDDYNVFFANIIIQKKNSSPLRPNA